MLKTLRPWQIECTQKAMNWFIQEEEKHFLMNAAPGAGKTICAAIIAKKLIESSQVESVIVIAPRKAVVDQWVTEFRQITDRPMTKITGADEDPEEYGTDLAATWSAVQGLLPVFQTVCSQKKTLIICDEHHHAAIKAAWGEGADGAFKNANYVLVLTGTPIRSDGEHSVWLAYDDDGAIDHPDDGTYTLSYGQAVDHGYCRPITFHRHEGKFSVKLKDGSKVNVSGSSGAQLCQKLNRITGLKQALDYYKLACTPHYHKNKPDINSYQASMLQWGINKLDDVRNRMANAGGLVIAPDISVAEYMAELLETLDGEKPMLVHTNMQNPNAKISAFRNNKKRWIVSVGMISEGVDLPRLRILVYLPNAKTELAFRQAMGRVVRNDKHKDDTRAYVVMPTHLIFEQYAKRVEEEMSASFVSEKNDPKLKVCPNCEVECDIGDKFCRHCDTEFPIPTKRQKACTECELLNELSTSECIGCGNSFKHEFEIALDEALRLGVIVRGMDLSEDETVIGEGLASDLREKIMAAGDDTLVHLISRLPEESWGRLASFVSDSKGN